MPPLPFDSMNETDDAKRLAETRQYWDQAAAKFDEEADHGLRDPAVRNAWMALVKQSLPLAGGQVLDIGCGTGSLSLVLAELGYAVTGIDLSPEMISLAKAKAVGAGYEINFAVMDAASPRFSPHRFDAIVCRHLLWALPEPQQVLQRWADLLKPAGYLLLIEGYWRTNVGLHAAEIEPLLPASLAQVSVVNLSAQPDLWGGAVTDERYAIIASAF